MGRLISVGASAARIVRDLRDTVASGTIKGDPVKATVEELGGYITVADALAAKIGAQAEIVRKARMERTHQDLISHDLILLISDGAFNEVGRAGGDPILELIYPEGGGTYAERPPHVKATALEVNAMMLETNRHPRLTDAWVADAAQRLRAQAAVMRGAADAVVPLAEVLMFLTKQYLANAKRGRVELGRVKKALAGKGLTEHEIHLVIPHHAKAEPKPKASPKVTPEAKLDAEVDDIINEAKTKDGAATDESKPA